MPAPPQVSAAPARVRALGLNGRLRNKVARARAWGLMSKYGWTLWGSIQVGISDLDFDFWGWAMEKYDRAVAEFDGPEFERLLADVQRAD